MPRRRRAAVPANRYRIHTTRIRESKLSALVKSNLCTAQQCGEFQVFLSAFIRRGPSLPPFMKLQGTATASIIQETLDPTGDGIQTSGKNDKNVAKLLLAPRAFRCLSLSLTSNKQLLAKYPHPAPARTPQRPAGTALPSVGTALISSGQYRSHRPSEPTLHGGSRTAASRTAAPDTCPAPATLRVDRNRPSAEPRRATPSHVEPSSRRVAPQAPVTRKVRWGSCSRPGRDSTREGARRSLD